MGEPDWPSVTHALGVLQARTARAESDRAEMKEEIRMMRGELKLELEKLHTDLRELQSTVLTFRGGWRGIVLIVTVCSALGAFATSIGLTKLIFKAFEP